MGNLVNKACTKVQFLKLKNCLQFINDQLDPKSENYNSFLRELVCDCMSYSAFSTSLFDIVTKAVEISPDEKIDLKCLILGKTEIWDNVNLCFRSGFTYKCAILDENNNQLFAPADLIRAFAFKYGEKIDKYEKEKQKKEKENQKKQESKQGSNTESKQGSNSGSKQGSKSGSKKSKTSAEFQKELENITNNESKQGSNSGSVDLLKSVKESKQGSKKKKA